MIFHVTGSVSYAVALRDGRECRRHIDHLLSRRTDSDSTIHMYQTGPVDIDTEIAPQNSYRPFSLVLPNRETEVVASIPNAPMTSAAPEATDVECDSVVTETRDVAVSARKTGRLRV